MAVSLRDAPPWIQLSYTSADSVQGGAGGWGVKEVTPGAPQHAVSALVDGVLTRVEEVEETTPFATDDVLAARVRVLTHRWNLDDGHRLWHAVPASRDGSGRPGNVFCHAACLADGAAMTDARPIELWRSQGWLTPFGAAEVNAARLSDLPLGTAITRESVLDFLLEPAAERRYALEWLVAGLTYCAARPAALVLVTDTPDEAAKWVGALSYLLPIGIARMLDFTTFERGRNLLEVGPRGMDIIAVPRVDLPQLMESVPEGCLLCDPTWELDEPEGGAWVTPAGQRFPEDSPWQEAALDLLALPLDQACRVLRQADALSALLSPETLESASLSWALRLALLADPESKVPDRESLLVETIQEVPAALISTDGRRLVDRLSQEERLRPLLEGLPRAPELNAADRAVALVHDYLRHGWEAGGEPPYDLSAEVGERVRRSLRGEILGALDRADTLVDSGDDGVWRAAELLSFLLDRELEPLVERDDVDAAGELQARLAPLLADLDPVAHADRFARLIPLLRPAPPAPSSARFIPRRNPAPPAPLEVPSSDQVPGPVLRHDVAVAATDSVALAPSPAAPSPAPPALAPAAISGHGGSRAVPRPVPMHVVPFDLRVPDSASLEGLDLPLRTADPGNPDARRVAEAVLTLSGGALAARQPDAMDTDRTFEIAAAHWLAGSPPWTLEVDNRERLAAWASRLCGRSLPPDMREAMGMWATVHHLLAQVPAEGHPAPTPRNVLAWAEQSPGVCVRGVLGALLYAPRESAVRLLLLALRRARLARADSVLDVPHPASSTVGEAVLTQLAGEHAGVLYELSHDVLERLGGSPDGEIVAQLQRLRSGAGSRTTLTGHGR